VSEKYGTRRSQVPGLRRDFAGILLAVIQDEIAQSVAASLRGGVLSRREREALVRPQTGAAAYEYYLRGRHHLPRLTEPDLEKSSEMFGRAIELDPQYGPAWAGLAMVHATMYEWCGAGDADLSRAERASQRARELAPDLAEPHAARGFVLSLSGRYDDASREFEEAIRINPNLFDAYYYFARLLERVFARGWGKRDWVDHDPDYDILRDDPRFQKLVARLK
jgi:adenylate cyclase